MGIKEIRTYTESDLYSEDSSEKPNLKEYTDSTKYRVPSWVGNKATEAEIQRDCIKYLKESGILHKREEAGAVYRQVSKDEMVRTSSRATGWPDVIAIPKPNGRLYGFEFKRPGSTIGAHQLAVLRSINKAGAKAGIVCSFNGMIEMLNGFDPKTDVQGVGVW